MAKLKVISRVSHFSRLADDDPCGFHIFCCDILSRSVHPVLWFDLQEQLNGVLAQAFGFLLMI